MIKKLIPIIDETLVRGLVSTQFPQMDSKTKAKDRRLYNTYGINLYEKNLMAAKQGGVCWICKQVPKSGILCVDHRHVKGYKKLSPEDKKKEVRALLCFMCNTGLHGIEKRKNARYILERYNEYFKTFKIKGD